MATAGKKLLTHSGSKDEVVHSKTQLIKSVKVSTDKFPKAIGYLLSGFKIYYPPGKLILWMCHALFHRYKKTISISIISSY